MSPAAPSEAPSEPLTDPLAEAVALKLSAAPQPLKLGDLVRGLARPKKVKPAAFKEEVLRVVEAEFQLGRAFRYPSGKGQEERFWGRDEKQVLREAALAAAARPVAMPALRTALGKAVKGTDTGFAEGVVRELIGQDRLFEYPPKTKTGGPLFGTTPPPPPLPVLEQQKFKKRTDTVAKSAAKLLADAGVGLDELLAALRHRLNPSATDTSPAPITPPSPDATATSAPGTEDAVLAAVAAAGPAGVMSLAELRETLPEEHRGPAFDAAVLRLADEGKVRIYQDADPLRFTPEERAGYVTDGSGHVFTAVAPPG